MFTHNARYDAFVRDLAKSQGQILNRPIISQDFMDTVALGTMKTSLGENPVEYVVKADFEVIGACIAERLRRESKKLLRG